MILGLLGRYLALGHRLKWGRNIDLRTLICHFWAIIGRLGKSAYEPVAQVIIGVLAQTR